MNHNIYLTMNKVYIRKIGNPKGFFEFGKIPVRISKDDDIDDEKDCNLIDIFDDIFSEKEYFDDNVQLTKFIVDKKMRKYVAK